MDPVSLVVTALAAGAAVGARDTAAAAVRDGYEALTRLLAARCAGSPAEEVALAEHDPATLGHALATTGVAEDPEVLAAAEHLLRLLDSDGARAGTYAVTMPGAQGVQLGDRNQQSNVFGSGPARH
jgi:hypothetical protein